MSEVKEKTKIQEINWVYIGIWLVLLIIMWVVYGIFAPNLVLFIIALVITVGGPILYYGLLWYKTSK
jgi:hypothetical protein